MKKILCLIFSVLMLLCTIGCKEREENEQSLNPFGPSEDQTVDETRPLERMEGDFFPVSMLFTSGVGAWSTELTLEADGSFTGVFHDSDMGVSDENLYPHGTVYVCSFEGSFKNIRKINEYTYTMTLDRLTSAQDEGSEWIEGGFKYIYSTPYGIEGGKEFRFYLPNAPVSVLSDEEYAWSPLRYESAIPDTLEHYALINTETAEGFFAEREDISPSTSEQPISKEARITFKDSDGHTWLVNNDIKSAEVSYVDDRYVVVLNFTEEGSAKFYEATKANIGKPIYIYVGDMLVTTATVSEAISGNEALITVSDKEAATILFNQLTGKANY